ncbi:PREDICTED: putative disease resistance protein RGA4 [Erythranthe guttata]|uniref:putative disease resistance protein RGA4 n=1 Tax=Erythranthe guttata TaxID=4155 RepID=UPI00064DB901|nr:PREDICTED: putative disease resistance protein RGA4 [Erythranthe guttata]|eukprot:XP_012830413.1 PREDICTED: putative disease resistance protein RGA4 [Erythranthe guttata]
MAEALIQIVLGNLSSLIQGEIGLILGVDEEMNNLFSTLTTIQSVLEDAEMKQLESRAIQNWLLKLNDLTYEIDDILDECATELSKLEHRSSKSSRYSVKKILFRYKIGRRMKEVAGKLDAVAAERSKFHLREMAIERPIEFSATRETGSILNVSRYIYGREEDAEKIVDILVNQVVNDNQEISVLPIVGIGGLGKTTLAQLVYNDQRVVEHFDKLIWVCVSDDFDLKTLLKAMIESGAGNASDLLHLDALQRCLWELLNNKRYFIVLDDVWNDDQENWSELRNVLACGQSGSSILVTTRLKKVADIMGTLPPHYLKGLSDEHCWLLMRERAFGQEKEEFPRLEAIGKQIVSKCAGVPLAAKALGGLLRFKRTEKEWNYVKESEIWELRQEETLILPALKLSYHHLPLSLRRCFAYCAVFRKDSKFRKEELIFMWMAHGCISSKGVLEVEDVGNQICDELILRSLLQYVTDASVPTLMMHDLVHDLAQSIMENKVPGTQVQRTNFRSASTRKIRQVSLPKKFLLFVKSNQPEMDMPLVLKNFLRLRILDASWTGIESLPCAVGNLKHLRQLNLSATEIRTLPDSICSLWNLQILNLNACEKLEVLPKKMRYLINLRHLFLGSCESLREMPSKMGELTSLRTLSMFIVGRNRGNGIEELQCLKLGGKLRIRHLERVENSMDAKKGNLAEKGNLRHLYLEWEPENTTASKSSGQEDIERDEKVLEALEPHPDLKSLDIKGFGGRHFPVWMSNSTLDKVVRMSISNCDNCLHLPPLGELSHLKLLSLENLALVEYIVEDQSGNRLTSVQQFPSLEKLYLTTLPKMKGLLKEQVTMGSAKVFPNLKELNIRDSSLSKLGLDALNGLSMDFKENTTTCMTVETLQSLSNLKKLVFKKACDLPEQGLRALKSVTHLTIEECDTLRCLPEGWLRHLTSLEELVIWSCRELEELPEEGIKHLHNLKKVVLYDLPKMVCVPKALNHLSSSLQSIHIDALPGLSSLPDWLGDMTSLQSLRIFMCRKPASLPASIQGMTNLEYLEVYGCPELKRRCEREKGDDWHKIAHIPCLEIG